MLLAAILFAPAAWAEDPATNDAADGNLSEVRWGDHWAGSKLQGPESLQGKVVLLQIWGGCVGCQEITPGMVNLAKQFRGEPFHVIASYCQEGDRTPVLEFLKSKGWDEKMDNLSVMSQTGYAPAIDVQHVPYYLLFDHTGKLRYHHVAGSYHGGNGDKYREQVGVLLNEVPQELRARRVQTLSEVRSWTNAKGRTMEAALVGVNEDLAKFRTPSGRTYNYPIKKLSGQSRQEIEELVAK